MRLHSSLGGTGSARRRRGLYAFFRTGLGAGLLGADAGIGRGLRLWTDGGTANGVHTGTGGTSGLRRERRQSESGNGGSGGTAADGGFKIDGGGSGGGGQCSASKPCEAGVCVAGQVLCERRAGVRRQVLRRWRSVPLRSVRRARQGVPDASGLRVGRVLRDRAGRQAPTAARHVGRRRKHGRRSRRARSRWPTNGRCLALPPKCDADGGAPDGGSCIQDCEYHPPVGSLTAVKKWQWGLDNPPVAERRLR